MILKELKCQRCNHRFTVECLDRDDPRERNQTGSPVRCPKCGSSMLEVVREISRRRSRAS